MQSIKRTRITWTFNNWNSHLHESKMGTSCMCPGAQTPRYKTTPKWLCSSDKQPTSNVNTEEHWGQEQRRKKRVGRTSLDLFLLALTMKPWLSCCLCACAYACLCVCVCICMCVWLSCVAVLCCRSEDVDKLSDPGKQQPQPRSIFDFEPGKTATSESRSQVHNNLSTLFLF